MKINQFMFNLSWVVFVLSLSASAAPLKVGLVLDRGGRDDKSFNSAAYAGAQRAQKELGVELKVVEASDDGAYVPMMRAFAQKGYDLIIAIGISQTEPLKQVAPQFLNRKFALVDGQADFPNVRSILFQENEGAYLVGAIAAMKSKTGKMGFIGGMDIPLIRRFQLGFESGVKSINPQASVASNYVGVTTEAWNNPPKAKELALSQYDRGVDVIFAAAGASNGGLFDAAEERKKFAIGVDSNQNWIKPGLVLTSMLKRIDVAVYEACKDASQSRFQGGVVRYGVKNEGIDFALDQFNSPLLDSKILTEARNIKKRIASGEIKVPDYYLRNANR